MFKTEQRDWSVKQWQHKIWKGYPCAKGLRNQNLFDETVAKKIGSVPVLAVKSMAHSFLCYMKATVWREIGGYKKWF